MAHLALALLLAALQAERPCALPTAVAEPLAAATLPLAEAMRRLRDVGPSDCVEVRVATAYVQGLLAAERAWRAGGTAASLAPVREHVAELDGLSAESPAAGLARLVLQAEIAAAQNEAGEMTLLLEQAFAQELRLRLATSETLPIVSVAEAAGDCWRRLFRYRESEQAYLKATARPGGSRVARSLAEVRRLVSRGRR